MSKRNLVNDVIARLREWAKKVAADIGSGGIYLFGSLVHRAGEQFGAASDVDLVVVFPDEADNTKRRAAWLEKLLSHKQSLEAELARALERNADKAICSIVAVTKQEIAANLHKDVAGGFFSENQFYDLLKELSEKAYPMQVRGQLTSGSQRKLALCPKETKCLSGRSSRWCRRPANIQR